MTLVIFSEDTIVALHLLHPLSLDLVFPPIFDYQLEHILILDRTLFTQALATFLICLQVGFMGWYTNISWDASYQRTHPQGFQN